MRSIKRIFQIILFISVSAGLIFGIYDQILKDQSATDSSALYGGQLERGYPSAGFLISYEPSGVTKTCGYAVLNSRIALTASHCVDNSAQIRIGLGDFTTDQTKSIKVDGALQQPAWVKSKQRSQDFAILNFNDNSGYFKNFAEIASPVEGCVYRVVAYGRTENNEENFIKPRKSGRMCAFDIKSDTFMIKSDDNSSGICFGDSGSPLFFEGTNQLAGNVVSIVLADPNDKNPCAIGNTAIVVRADNHQQLISEQLEKLDDPLLTNSISVNDGGTLKIEISDNPTILDRLGLSNLTAVQKKQYLLYGAIGGTILLIVILIIVLLTPTKEASSQEQQLTI